MRKELERLAYEHTMAIERGLLDRARELSREYDELEKALKKEKSSRK